MPSKSKSQHRFMKSIEKGYIKKPGLPKKEAREYTKDVDYKDLPEKKSKKKSKRWNKLFS